MTKRRVRKASPRSAKKRTRRSLPAFTLEDPETGETRSFPKSRRFKPNDTYRLHGGFFFQTVNKRGFKGRQGSRVSWRTPDGRRFASTKEAKAYNRRYANRLRKLHAFEFAKRNLDPDLSFRQFDQATQGANDTGQIANFLIETYAQESPGLAFLIRERAKGWGGSP